MGTSKLLSQHNTISVREGGGGYNSNRLASHPGEVAVFHTVLMLHRLIPSPLLFKGDEGLRRNDVIKKIAGYAGKNAKNRVASRKKFGFPLMQCAVVKSFSAATGNKSVLLQVLKNQINIPFCLIPE